jgi:hypothetical protein
VTAICSREGRRDGNQGHDGAERVAGSRGDPTHVHHDGAPAHEGRVPLPTSDAASEPATSRSRRNPVSTVLAKLLSALRGDKYMADAYPPTPGPSAAAHEGGDVAPAPSRTQER